MRTFLREIALSMAVVGNSTTSQWQELAARKRADTLAKIPEAWILPESTVDEAKNQPMLTGAYMEGLLDPDTLRITRLDSSELIHAMTSGDLTSLQVVRAFCKRAAFAHQVNDNLLDIMFESALQRAEELDAHILRTKEPIGSLHGLPFSVKDQFHVKDAETTMAYVGWIGTFEGAKGTGKEGNVQSEIVNQLVRQGAIPIAKTSPTQTLWYAETNNNILGYNWNPHNRNLSSGGSSGGQGAFQALRGSTLGLGTDVGGSVTIPASFNGLYSIVPSNGRLSFRNVPNSSSGQVVTPTRVGIFGNDLSTLQLALQAIVEAKPWHDDSELFPLPWRHELADDIKRKSRDNKLCLGFMDNDGIVTPHPPVQRAMKIVGQAISARGLRMVSWSPPTPEVGIDLQSKILYADGKADVVARLKLSGEPVIPELASEVGDKPRPPLPLPEYYSVTTKLTQYRQEYHDYWMSSCDGQPVDAVILPVAPHAAVLPGRWYHYGYSSTGPIHDRPVVTIPVTVADAGLDPFDEDYVPKSDLDEKNWRAYDAERYDGGPVGIQILGARLEEEKLLAVAEFVLKALQASQSP